MSHGTRSGDAEPAVVRLHLHRGIGWGFYGTATVLVLVLVLLGVGYNLVNGRYLATVAIAVAGLAVAGFLGVITHSLVTPALTVSGTGISGRMPRGTTVDAAWDEITVDVDDTTRDGTLRLDIGEESVSVGDAAWIGFGDFLLLVASTPAATDRLTPAAVREVTRLLQAGVSSGRRSHWH